LASVEWEIKYPLSKVTLLPKGCSDHNPLRFEFENKSQYKENIFRFEKWWFEMKEFEEVVHLELRMSYEGPSGHLAM
jgi:hypothetical protein